MFPGKAQSMTIGKFSRMSHLIVVRMERGMSGGSSVYLAVSD